MIVKKKKKRLRPRKTNYGQCTREQMQEAIDHHLKDGLSVPVAVEEHNMSHKTLDRYAYLAIVPSL